MDPVGEVDKACCAATEARDSHRLVKDSSNLLYSSSTSEFERAGGAEVVACDDVEVDEDSPIVEYTPRER